MSAAAGSSQTSGSNRLYDIPSLENDGSNFQTWKFRISTVLGLRGLMGLVDGTEKRPVAVINADVATNQSEIDDWDRRDLEAKAQLTLTVKDEPLSGIIHATSAFDVWDKLNSRYEGKGQNTVAYLIKEIFRATLTDEMPMEPQLNDIRHKAYILKTLGEPISDSVVAQAMLLALPDSYSTLRTILNSSPATAGGSSLSTDTVITQVLTEEKNAKLGNSQVAFLAHGKGKGKPFQKSDGDKKKKKCDYCKKKGHIKSECRKLKADQAVRAETNKGGEKKDGDMSAKVVMVKESEMSEKSEEMIRLFMAEVLAGRNDMGSKWIVDSGASSHMSSRRDWFVTYQKLQEPRRVWLGDERFILAVGVGRVQIVVSINGQNFNYLIPNVYHVPELSRNLLSVSTLSWQGYKLEFTRSGCQLIKSNEVIATAQEEGVETVIYDPVT